MTDLMFSGKDCYIAMADQRTAGLIAATEALFTQISGASASQDVGAQNIGFGAGVDLGGFGR